MSFPGWFELDPGGVSARYLVEVWTSVYHLLCFVRGSHATTQTQENSSFDFLKSNKLQLLAGTIREVIKHGSKPWRSSSHRAAAITHHFAISLVVGRLISLGLAWIHYATHSIFQGNHNNCILQVLLIPFRCYSFDGCCGTFRCDCCCYSSDGGDCEDYVNEGVHERIAVIAMSWVINGLNSFQSSTFSHLQEVRFMCTRVDLESSDFKRDRKRFQLFFSIWIQTCHRRNSNHRGIANDRWVIPEINRN